MTECHHVTTSPDKSLGVDLIVKYDAYTNLYMLISEIFSHVVTVVTSGDTLGSHILSSSCGRTMRSTVAMGW